MRFFSPITFLLKPIIKHDQEQKRLQVEARIPKVPLREEHTRNCRLLLDRVALLKALPAGAVGAEIGVDQGEFTQLILQHAQPAVLHLVDNWATRRYNDAKADAVKARFAERIADGRVVLHRALSLQAVGDFADASLDWIYIDSSHAYDVTAGELRAYAPKMKPGGIIAGHDYSMGNWEKGFRYGVIEAVHEFCVRDGWELLYLTIEPTERQSFALRKLPA
jgi:predicted O-methyltransferase YrrM